jgi:predicted permease
MAMSAFVPSGAAPSLMANGEALLSHRRAPAWRIMGRLRPDKTLAEARADVEVVARRLAADFPVEHKGAKPLLIPENRARPDPSFADFTPIFAAVFMGMVGLVLFTSCANVVNLMLSRALVRQRDLALRSALGASRFRLVRLQVVESMVLALLAGTVGLLFGHWSGQALAGFTPTSDIPVNTDHPWDWRVYAFTFIVSVAAGVGTGLWPALKASRFHLTDMLKEGGGRSAPSRHRLRNMLVMGQVTMALVVLICGGLFVHSLRQLGTSPLGFRPEHLLMASLDLGLQRYDEASGRQFLERLTERTKTLPGVSSATLSLHVPFDLGFQVSDVAIDGEIPGSKDGYVSTSYNVVGHDFFETAGVRLRSGRGFERADGRDSRRVAVVNETMARKLWPREEPVGKRFRLGRDGDWIAAVGVAGNGKYVMMAEEPRAYFYLPLEQHYRSPITLMVRSASDPDTVVKPLQQLLLELDPNLPVFNVRTMERHIRDSVFGLMPLRMGATMAAFQGVVGLLMAVLGLYAVVSYAVNQRTREIGVRMALGARQSDVLRLVVREGMRLTAIGAAIGLLVALAAGFGLSHLLYGVDAVDPRVIIGVTGLLLGVSALACYLPARRATRVDPLVSLRYE